MNNKLVYIYILNTLADWEPGYIIAELNSKRYFKKDAAVHTVKTFALTKEPIKTMGGMHIVPDLTVDEIETQNSALLLLPGADTWLEPSHTKVIEKRKEFLNSGVPVGAICGATLALANAGILDDRPHTSNDLSFLQHVCKMYKGEQHYQFQPAVTGGDLVTASGLASLEFAYHIFKRLDVFSAETLEAWYKLYKTQESQYFFQLMKTLE